MNTKKYYLIILPIVAILGSLFTAFASNMFFGDIINIQAGFAHATFFTTLPAVTLAVSFVIITLYFIRIYKHPDCFKSITRLYLILLIAFNAIGVLGCILAAAITYHTLLSNNPFPGYLIIFMVFNLLLIAEGVVGLIFLRKIKKDEGKVKINFLYVLKTIGWVLFIFLAFNRFGTFLVAPTYIYWLNFYMTFPFYIWLLTPLYYGVVQVLFILGILNKRTLLIFAIAGMAVNVCLFTSTAIMGILDTSYIASLSQAMPLERMLSKPIEMPIHLLSYLGVGAALIVQSVKKEKQ